MSYDIYLMGKDGVLSAPKHEDRGTYAIGGTDKAELNVTYNYCKHFSFKGLHERKALDTIKEMQEAVDKLGTKRDNDYWASTKGNAGAAVQRLLSFALLHPYGVWDVR
jgi:hypothetical protein